MYHEQVSPRYYIFGAAWLLLGLVVGLHLPDIDGRLQGLVPSWLLLHRSILTHGMRGGAAFVLLSSISEKIPDLAASAWFDKHTGKDAIMFMREWDKAAKEFAEHNPVKQKAKVKPKSRL